jgi:hypothetical protein
MSSAAPVAQRCKRIDARPRVGQLPPDNDNGEEGMAIRAGLARVLAGPAMLLLALVRHDADAFLPYGTRSGWDE